MPNREEYLYPEIEKWLNQYLKERYKGHDVISTYETSRLSLDTYLKQSLGIEIKEAIGLSIKVDIMAVIKGKDIKLVLVEVKDKPLTLKDLGQLWGYSQLIDPIESFLISSKGLGSLNYLLNVLNRKDLLFYGQKRERMMRVCKWDEKKQSIDYFTLIPKL
jgi:hypothetical protein